MSRRTRHRRRNELPSIHDPPDPSPRTLPDQARAEWDAVYEDATGAYGKKDVAERTAWRTIDLRWRQSGKKTWTRCQDGLCEPWPQAHMMPRPKTELVGLGVLIEYTFVDPSGELVVAETDKGHPPILWWDDERKMLYAFPRMPYPTCEPIPGGVEDAVETYRRWHQRDPECFVRFQFTPVKLHCIGAGDTVSYRSDKWKKRLEDPRVRKAQEYIHSHWYDVWVWQDRARNGVPNAIIIEGGELDLHEKGLIH